MKNEKHVEEKNEKTFTKNERNIIISKKYNLLSKNKIYEREGLCMLKLKVKKLKKQLYLTKDINEKTLECFLNVCNYYKLDYNIINKFLGEN